MAKRRSRKKNDDGLGCLVALIEIIGSLLLMLFTSEDPTARKIGWGIVGVLGLFYALTSAGISGEEALGIIGVIAVIVVIILVIIAFASNDNHSGNTDNLSGTSSTVQKTNNVEKKETVAPALETVKKETFEDQLEKMEQQARKVCGDNFRQKNVEEKLPATEIEDNTEVHVTEEVRTTAQKVKEKYYRSVENALENQTVPVDYKKIMIEHIQKTDIKECPGLIWKDDAMLYVLPLLKSSKTYSWPLSSIPIILYEKRMNPDVDKEFMDVGRAAIAAEFEEVFPEYPFGPDGVYTGKFILPVGLEVTNTSGKILFDMVSAEFHVVDDITQSMWYAKEIKELYQKNILKENGIISFEKYAEEKERLLKAYKARERNEEKFSQQLESAKKLQLC